MNQAERGPPGATSGRRRDRPPLGTQRWRACGPARATAPGPRRSGAPVDASRCAAPPGSGARWTRPSARLLPVSGAGGRRPARTPAFRQEDRHDRAQPLHRRPAGRRPRPARGAGAALPHARRPAPARVPLHHPRGQRPPRRPERRLLRQRPLPPDVSLQPRRSRLRLGSRLERRPAALAPPPVRHRSRRGRRGLLQRRRLRRR